MYFSSDNPDPSSPQNQVVTGDKVKKKKRKIPDLDIMGGSDVEEAPKRKRHKQNSESQETVSAPLTGDTYTEEQADQETPKKKKKKKKGESHREADDVTADDASSSVLHHGEKNKKSKDSKKLHEDEGFAEEAPYSELTALEGRSKKEKKKSKKDRREQDVDVSLVEESLTADTHHGKKKKKRKDGGALREDGFSEELYTQRKSPDGSETPQQLEESVDQSEKPVKKKKSHRSHQEADDITTNDASSSVGLQGDKPSHSELTDTEERTIRKKKKKSKKDHGERLVEDNLVEESLAAEAQHTSRKKTKRKDGGDEGQRQLGLTEELVTKRKHQGGSETPEQVPENVDQSEKAAKKKKKRKDRSHQEADDITTNDASSSIGLHGDKHSHSELTDTEERLSQKKKEKSKKDHGDQLLEDNLEEESSATEAQHTSRKKTKRKDGGDEGQRQPGLTEELVTKRKHQGGTETPKQVAASEDQAENSLMEELVIPENHHAKKKKRKQNREGDIQEDGLTEELVTKRKRQGGSESQEQVEQNVDQSEKAAKKKKKRKERSHQEADDITADDASSSIGLHGDKPPHDTEDRTIQKKKKKSKKDHGERLVEDSQVGKSLTPGAQHGGEKTKQNEGGDESHGFTDRGDQAEVPAKKKMVKKKQSDRKKDTREMSAEDNVPMGSPMMNRSFQSRAVGGDAHQDTEETSTGSGPDQNVATQDGPENVAIQDGPENVATQDGPENAATQDGPENAATQDGPENVATQDGPETVQDEGNNRPTTTARNTQNRATKVLRSMREKDLALLEEYIPNFKTLRDASIISLVQNDMDRIRAAKREGIRFHTGKFTVEEDEQLKKNVEKFVLDVGIDSAEKLFHPYKFPDEMKTIKQLKSKYNFRIRIAEGLHRLSNYVFERGFTLYECPRLRGRYTKEEVKLLKECSEKYNNKWSLVSTVLNRSCGSLASKAADIRRDVNSGKWSLEEVNCLISVMKDFVLKTLREEGHSMEEPVIVPKEKLYKGVQWVWVEERVKTRTHYQCVEKWLIIVLLRMNNYVNPLRGALGLKNSIEIIRWLHNAKVRDPRDVDWDKLSDHLGNVPIRSAQNAFYKLMWKIEGYKKMRLYEIVDYLYKNTLPELEAKMIGIDCPKEPERRSSFLISEIFFESVDGM